ncbi:MAG: HAMP domain-containing histidine kinase [Chloroflexota bacterium]|nr:HAMP domain-containing histidine kinase [Chloroflexota bacterium]
MGYKIFQVYKALSIVLLAIAVLVFATKGGHVSVVVILVDLLFLGLVLGIRTVRQRGLRSILHMPRPVLLLHGVFVLYKTLSLVIIVIGVIALVSDGMNKVNQSLYFSIGPVIIIDVLLLYTVSLANGLRKGGLRSVVRLFRSTRFRLTLWFVALLALILLVFGGTIYTITRITLTYTEDTYLHTRLTQIASTYNAQSGRLTLAPESATLPPSLAAGNTSGSKSLLPGREVFRLKGTAAEVVLLMTPRGEPLQWSGDLTHQDIAFLAEDGAHVTHDQMADPNWPYTASKLSVSGSTGSNDTVVYDLGTSVSYDVQGANYEFTQALIIGQKRQVVAILILGTPSHVSDQLSLLSSILEIATPLILLLSSGIGYWLADRAMRPVQTIARAVQQIGETDLHRRLKLRRRDELGELAATFDHMLDRLESAFERQRQFTADASHELRTPLSIVDLEATRALAQDTPQVYQQALSVIQQENRHMARLVGDLLTLARADNGPSRLQHEVVDLSEVIVDSVERLAPLAQQTGITIKVAPLPELAVLGDRIYLVQLVTNIVENALKYSAGVGTHVDISLERLPKQGQEWAMLRVFDDGPGIAREHLPHIFERFYRVDQSRTHSQQLSPAVVAADACPAGNGLGLSIAQWIARAHDGDIQVRSEPGHCSIFEIWLPAWSLSNLCAAT